VHIMPSLSAAYASCARLALLLLASMLVDAWQGASGTCALLLKDGMHAAKSCLTQFRT
jgi:hypothetical protein